jgi:hypothetical protein
LVEVIPVDARVASVCAQGFFFPGFFFPHLASFIRTAIADRCFAVVFAHRLPAIAWATGSFGASAIKKKNSAFQK